MKVNLRSVTLRKLDELAQIARIGAKRGDTRVTLESYAAELLEITVAERYTAIAAVRVRPSK